ncbi:aminotransferase class V-fold PLP-dependent enzyme [Ihubacter sp. rT4E-8]|uniref:aminotransferase class V-fold PLP-dependent enzyme n=1 Tax=Ihubacter sp. rT4E-8 TaxID=3242369 RepID=UPI003CFB0A74
MKNGYIYLDNAGTSIPHETVKEAATEYVKLLKEPALLNRRQADILSDARRAAAAFLNCENDEIALVRSTSQALGTLACSLPLKRGQNVLICDLEYQASTACWHPRVERDGVELRCVKTQNGRVTAEDFARYIDENTKVILLASVQEINGFRADIQEISRLAKKHHCYFLVDGIQEAGALQVDVKALGMDIYCAGGKKWIGNPFGCGFMYIRKELLSQVQPPYYSYMDIRLEEGVPFDVEAYIAYLESPVRHPFDKVHFAKTADVFEAGGYDNYVGALGLYKALQHLMDMGMEAVERQILGLRRRLLTGLKQMNVLVTSPEEESSGSAIVSFSLHDLADCDVSRERALVSYLKSQGIQVSLRCTAGTGGIRVSPHYYNREVEIDIFLETVKHWLKKEL